MKRAQSDREAQGQVIDALKKVDKKSLRAIRNEWLRDGGRAAGTIHKAADDVISGAIASSLLNLALNSLSLGVAKEIKKSLGGKISATQDSNGSLSFQVLGVSQNPASWIGIHFHPALPGMITLNTECRYQGIQNEHYSPEDGPEDIAKKFIDNVYDYCWW